MRRATDTLTWSREKRSPNLYSEHDIILNMVKPYETRPATSSIKKASGYCILCGKVATKEALFHVEGAVIIQRYCDICVPKANYEMDAR